MTRTLHTRMVATSATLAAAALLLTGCANPIDAIVERGTEALIEQGSGGSVDIDSDGGGATFKSEDGTEMTFGSDVKVPDAWPDLPLPDGTLTGAVSTAEGLSLTFETTAQAAESLVSKLQSEGYEVSETVSVQGMEMRVLAKGDSAVNLQWMTNEDGVFLMYVVSTT